MFVILANAFSLQMIEKLPAAINVMEISKDVAVEILKNGFVSAIGHEDTAKILTDKLGLPVAHARVNFSLNKDTLLIVAQVVGGRLPEGATSLPAGTSIKFLTVLMEEK